jgi:uncharacterized RDD family membrane protein YckC
MKKNQPSVGSPNNSSEKNSSEKNSAEKNSPVVYASPSLLRMLAAMVYDSLLLAAVSIAYGALVVGARVLIVGGPEVGQRIHWGILSSTLITLGWLAVLILFYVFFWHKFGQTLGMKTWRLQVIDSLSYQQPSYKQCMVRSLMAIVSFITLGFGYWCKFFHPQQKMLHDLFSGTHIILLKKQ